ncbi:MAG: RNA polymerase sigma-70 factor [Odoribacter sp.]
MEEFSLNIEQFKQGDRQAFKTVFDSLYKSLCLFANHFINNLPAAEDIVQDTFLSLWSHREEMMSTAHVKSFLYMATRNETLDYIKHEKIKNCYNIQAVEKLETTEGFANFVIEEEVEQILLRTEESLPEKCKEIFILAMQGKENEEIADILNISINTVKTQKKIAYKKLKKYISDFSLMLFLISQN